jgi:hypothetical protein
MQSDLAGRQQRLLDVIRSFGEAGCSRQDIASTLGKRKLNPSEATLLQLMADGGLIEARKIERTGPITFEWRYFAR